MAAAEIDEYLSGIDEPKRGTLQALRGMILEIVLEAEQGISYRIPAFRVNGRVIAGLRRVQRPPELPAVQRVGPRTAWR